MAPEYVAGEKPSEAALRRQLNALKDEQFPWMREVTKNAPQQGIKNLGRAYGSFFEDLAKHRRGELFPSLDGWRCARRCALPDASSR
jgi:transposase